MAKNRYKLSYRPASYWKHSDPLQAILSGISGTARRAMITDYWKSGRFEELNSGLIEDNLKEEIRQQLGRIHPYFMGGEYLPPRLPGEVAIVTIRLESTTFDVIELRARPLPDGKIGLRWVDEYDSPFEPPFEVINRPFSFGQLIKFIEGTMIDLGVEESLPHVYNSYNYQWVAGEPEEVENLRNFTSFSSDFYPELDRWAWTETEKWFDEKIAEEEEART